MSTPLQTIYDAFFLIAQEDFTYKQDQVYEMFKYAIGRSYKTTPHKLGYKLFDNNVVYIVKNTLENTNGVNFNIKLLVNNVEYSVLLDIADTKQEIAKKIKDKLITDYDVEIQNTENPLIIISKVDILSINSSFIDYEDSGLDLNISKTYSGVMDEELSSDEIELISLFMKRKQLEKRKAIYESVQVYIGTKDFNKLPDYAEKLKACNNDLKELDNQISSFRQEFYSYSN